MFFWVFLATGVLVPRPGIEPTSPAVETCSLNYWTAREVPSQQCLKFIEVRTFRARQARFRTRWENAQVNRVIVQLGRSKCVYYCPLYGQSGPTRLDYSHIKVCR